MRERSQLIRLWIMFIALAGSLWLPAVSFAHCDTLDGPVVKTAAAALEKGDVAPVLKWVRKGDEKEIRELFDKTLVVRKQGKDAKELADRYFFETIVRIHRAGEGASYTGLKPAGAVEPSVAAADMALAGGSADELIKMLTDAVAKGIRERFQNTLEAKKHADHTIEAGRKFVAAYVEFTHYVERLHTDAAAPSGHAHDQASGQEQHKH
jgi:hypothetical protein